MNIIKYFGICLLAYLPLSALAAQTSSIASEWDLRMECSNSTPSEAEMTRCLKAKALKSQKELQNTEKKMIKILSEWDEDPSNINIAKANLTTANKEFIKYRDAQCKFNYSLGGGAIENALEMRLFACIAELNNRRNQQLIDLMSDILPK
ncbi:MULTISPECIES: lysozyme inhibitor LprI family protein [unclassified Snodgrassella]|uniref:lysozyme inhibitor LprI family protein n=1 Tax=unclassified Snodgrassella TaxID=2625236 RepID=UPI0018DCE5B0|nr:DUF1311 domain-containing protein [Snodgrassella sp. M0110]MBI0077026.1 DUF1311 domain-containing protein [Snodgrassella sp. M0118]MBI0079327.1 DUF1311 domain-containing protein [Snodgrassella sp. M0112]